MHIKIIALDTTEHNNTHHVESQSPKSGHNFIKKKSF